VGELFAASGTGHRGLRGCFGLIALRRQALMRGRWLASVAKRGAEVDQEWGKEGMMFRSSADGASR
jgi:hypothetical protein